MREAKSDEQSADSMNICQYLSEVFVSCITWLHSRFTSRHREVSSTCRYDIVEPREKRYIQRVQ